MFHNLKFLLMKHYPLLPLIFELAHKNLISHPTIELKHHKILEINFY